MNTNPILGLKELGGQTKSLTPNVAERLQEISSSDDKRSQRARAWRLPFAFAPYLDDAHVEAGLLRQLLPDVTRGLGRGHESGLEGLQLLGLDGGARAAPLGARVLLLVLDVVALLVRRRAVVRLLQLVVQAAAVLRVRRQAPVRARRHCGRRPRGREGGREGGNRHT